MENLVDIFSNIQYFSSLMICYIKYIICYDIKWYICFILINLSINNDIYIY